MQHDFDFYESTKQNLLQVSEAVQQVYYVEGWAADFIIGIDQLRDVRQIHIAKIISVVQCHTRLLRNGEMKE